jgi:hypothetical protein
MSNEDLLQNKELIDEMTAHDGGHVKRASIATSKATRTHVREEGFQRAILPFEDITNADLDYTHDSELPAVWYELEPDVPPARNLPYNATPHTRAYRAENYVVLLSVVSTEEMTKNVNELRTYKTDVRQMVTDNLMREIHVEEDTSFIVYIDRLVGTSIPYADDISVDAQNVSMDSATINRVNLKRAISFLLERQLTLGCVLLNQRTANEVLGWHRNEIGGDKAQELLFKGHKALEKHELFGVPFISTIKNQLVYNGVMYQFAPQEFLGHSLMLEDITVTIKKEYNMIRMRAQEQIGTTIGNSRGLQKLTFEMEPLATLPEPLATLP